MEKCYSCKEYFNIDDLNTLGSIFLCEDCYNIEREFYEDCYTDHTYDDCKECENTKCPYKR
jgi:hypothetical protein